MGFEPGLAGLKSNVLITEPKRQLPDVVVKDWIYTYRLCVICQGRYPTVGVTGRNILPFQGSNQFSAK